jgi:hypothetical protein
MDPKMLLVAIGCSRLPGILNTALSQPVVVFGTMDETLTPGLASDRRESALPVYFYETG